MQIYRFRSVKDQTLVGLAVDKSGSAFPIESGKWEPLYGAQMPQDVDTFSAEVVEALRRDGYYIQGGITVTLGGSSPRSV